MICNDLDHSSFTYRRTHYSGTLILVQSKQINICVSDTKTSSSAFKITMAMTKWFCQHQTTILGMLSEPSSFQFNNPHTQTEMEGSQNEFLEELDGEACIVVAKTYSA